MVSGIEIRAFAGMTKENGFTLIELSIVLVIIGLIVGGVLVGQNLIRAAETRAQITQIEKYNTAINTFKSKFNYLPGDMRPEIASQFGFVQGISCNGGTGSRNGNGLIETIAQACHEPALFWSDLSSSQGGNLIEGTFPGDGTVITCAGGPGINIPATYIGNFIPTAKIGHGNYVNVYSNNSLNWFGVSAMTSIDSNGIPYSNTNLSVIQSYNIDLKVDDGLPTTGNVQATYLNSTTAAIRNAPNTTTSGGTSSSCYDTTTGTYSVTVNNGNGGNCALSFRFQ